ncbi:hypothetical protein ACFUNF_21065, partial [Streptomyces sp. NPDC057291]|uniref:hypothetical protein n=1 Tax=Streptomyces sp. NPDC057291 TaxID=3346087 RepID=UPI003641FD40
MRGCFSAGDGAGFDPATGIVTASLSADVGNTTAFSTDVVSSRQLAVVGEPAALGVAGAPTQLQTR